MISARNLHLGTFERYLLSLEEQGRRRVAAMPAELLSIQPGELKFPCMFSSHSFLGSHLLMWFRLPEVFSAFWH